MNPTYFPSVPRIFEKIYTAATAAVEKEGGLKKRVFDWAVEVGKKVREVERKGKRPGPLLAAQYRIADKQVLSKIRGLFGKNLKLAVSGAAPINPEILRFFDAAGVLILEGWGMTETSTAATIATPDDFKFGTIGRPFPGCEVKIAEDGEILAKGPNIFQGYYKNAEATAETLVDGWLHTGDIGGLRRGRLPEDHRPQEGHHHHRRRQEHHPGEPRGARSSSTRWSRSAWSIGDRRPYLVALVTLDPEEAIAWARDRGLPQDLEAIAAHADVRESIEAHVGKINQKFARVEQVKKIEILPQDLSQEGGELTPTMKIKRNVVADKYADRIEALYAG